MTPTSPGGSEPAIPSPAAAAVGPNKGAIGLLMEMEMPLVVRFGTTRMALADILALSAGSVVEFRRAPDEPVDLIVNGRVVARAQVVVVQGNYGVKITEIVSQREDLVSDVQPAARTIRGNN